MGKLWTRDKQGRYAAYAADVLSRHGYATNLSLIGAGQQGVCYGAGEVAVLLSRADAEDHRRWRAALSPCVDATSTRHTHRHRRGSCRCGREGTRGTAVGGPVGPHARMPGGDRGREADARARRPRDVVRMGQTSPTSSTASGPGYKPSSGSATPGKRAGRGTVHSSRCGSGRPWWWARSRMCCSKAGPRSRRTLSNCPNSSKLTQP